MTSGAVPLTQGAAWNALREHYDAIKAVQMRDLFAKDPGRGARLVCDAQGIYLDYSKNRLTDDTMRLLLDLANTAGLRAGIDAMFRGDKLNVTENSSCLRCPMAAIIAGVGGSTQRSTRPSTLFHGKPPPQFLASPIGPKRAPW